MYQIPSANCASTKDRKTRRNSSTSRRRLTHDKFTSQPSPRPPDFWVRAQKFPPTTWKTHPHTSCIREEILQLSRRRGWARLGEQFLPRVRTQRRTSFLSGKSAKNPLICRTRQTGRRRCRMKNSAITRNRSTNDPPGSRCWKVPCSTKRC